MHPQERKLRSRFRGALLGCAVGDALGFPHQDYSRSFMRSLPGPLTAAFPKHSSGFYPLGQYSDDTQEACAVAEAIIESGGVDGQIVAEHMIPLWRDQLIVDRSLAGTEAMQRIVKGETTWEHSGLPLGRIENCSIPRVIAVGLWEHAHLEDLGDSAEKVTAITHRDPRPIAASAAYAAALAYAVVSDDLILGTFIDQVSRAAGRFSGDLAEAILDFPRILSQTEYRAHEIICRVAEGGPEGRTPGFDEGVTDNAIMTILAVIYDFLKNPFDFEKAVESALRAGGDVDTVAALTGALSGSLLGQEAIPEHLATGVLDSAVIEDRADRLLNRWLECKGPKDE